MKDSNLFDISGEVVETDQITDNGEDVSIETHLAEEQVVTQVDIAQHEKIQSLKFVRLIDPSHIPQYLIDQIKSKKFTSEMFYKYHKICCITQDPLTREQILNPSNFLYALVDEVEEKVKGFLWMVADFLTKTLEVRNFSIDNGYWQKGKALIYALEKAKTVMNDINFNRIAYQTINKDICESMGMVKPKSVTMVYEKG